MAEYNLADLKCANPIEATRAEHRHDPYWDGLWTSNGTAWARHAELARAARDGADRASGVTKAWCDPIEQTDALDRMLGNGLTRKHSLEALSALMLFRTLTGEQMRAFTGMDGWRSYRGERHPRLALPLYNADLADVGVPAAHPLYGNQEQVTLLRPSIKAPWRKLQARLTADEWWRLTTGLVPRPGSQFERHNTLTSELLLRAAEYLPVSLVAGEHLVTLKTMAPPGVIIPASATSLAGDGMIVRPDGLRIVIELVATWSTVRDKGNKWANWLAQDRKNNSMCVVFLYAPHPDSPSHGKAVRKAVRQGAQSRALDGVTNRMFYAEWSDWFPSRHVATSDFLSLTAQCPKGPIGESWRTERLLDPFSVEGPVGAVGEGLLSSRRHLLGLPHWMRDAYNPNSTELLRIWAEQTEHQAPPNIQWKSPAPKAATFDPGGDQWWAA